MFFTHDRSWISMKGHDTVIPVPGGPIDRSACSPKGQQTIRPGKLNSQFIFTTFSVLHAGGRSLFRFHIRYCVNKPQITRNKKPQIAGNNTTNYRKLLNRKTLLAKLINEKAGYKRGGARARKMSNRKIKHDV